jgi:hypothetical protein
MPILTYYICHYDIVNISGRSEQCVNVSGRSEQCVNVSGRSEQCVNVSGRSEQCVNVLNVHCFSYIHSLRLELYKHDSYSKTFIHRATQMPLLYLYELCL